MAYVNVAEWKPDQVTEWLKGLDSAILPYLQLFLNNETNGQQLLNVRSEDLNNLGIKRLGHQELILEAVEHLRNFHYELDRENLQLLALRLSCQSHSLHNELLRHSDSQPVSTQTLADVASVVRAVKPLVCWLDRSPFSGQLEYADRKTDLLKYSLEIATCAQRDRFAERPVEEIRSSCGKLAAIADGIIQDIADPLILQPASLDLATLRKRGGDDLGFFILPSFYGIHQVGEIKFGSPAHQCGKVEEGDEVVQVNYQTVVGWQRKKVMALLEESLTDVFLTLKKRPRHTKVYGQIYMKPYRLPSKKRAPAYTRWHDNLPSPRPELLTIPDFEILVTRTLSKSPPARLEPLGNTITSTSSESDDVGSGCDEASIDYELEGHTSPTSMRLYLPKPRVPVQRRATITGASPTSHLTSVDIEKFWRELKLEKKWKVTGKTPNSHNSNPECRFLQNKSPCEQSERPSTCLGFEKSSSIEYVKNVNYISKSDTINSENKSVLGEQQVSENFKVDGSEANSALSCKPSLEDDRSPKTHKTKSKKRFITRLELMVDPLESQTEFTNVKCKDASVVSSTLTGPLPNTPDSPSKANVSSNYMEKTRKISTESQVGELPMQRERGRLDKSFSTPAYDLSGLDRLDVKSPSSKNDCESTDRLPSKINHLSNKPFGDQKTVPDVASTSPNMRKEESYSQDIFQFPPVLKLLVSDPSIRSQQDESPSQTNFDVNSNSFTHGRVVETINHHLLHSYKRNDGERDSDEWCNSHRESQGLSKTVTNITVNSPDIISDITSFRLNVKPGEDFVNGNHICTDLYPGCDNFKTVPDCNISGSSSKVFQEKPPEPKMALNELSPGMNVKIHASNPFEALSPKVCSSDGKNIHPTPPARQLVSSDLSEHPISPRMPVTVIVNPPDPPPRPNPPSKSTSIPSEQHKSIIRAKLSSKVGAQKATLGSPKVSRKKNPFLTKRRSVSVKELGIADYQGWLYRRLRIGDSGAQWIKGWFILRGTAFYGFKSKEANKADCFISLPGFTTSTAEEVKSRKFAFKVYHTGTVFYFAAESDEELAAWLDCLSMATFALDVNILKTSATEGAVFSETEDECDDEAEVADSCFPSPKMRKFTNFLSGHSNASSGGGSPKPAHSHQNLTSSTDSKSYDIQKRFGSLKKLGYRTKVSNQLSSQSLSSTTSLTSSDQGSEIPIAPHSLDRKVLRFLSSSKSPVPVPTSQFKSYRRVAATEPSSPSSKHPDGVSCSKGDEASLEPSPGSLGGRNILHPFTDLALRRNIGLEGREATGVLTLEQFMLQRQEEERQQSQNSNHERSREQDQERRELATPNHREASEAYTGYTEDPVLTRHKSLEKRRTIPPAPISKTPSTQRPIPAVRTIIPAASRATACEPPAIVPRSLKPSLEAIDSRCDASSYPQHSSESCAEVGLRNRNISRQPHLKNAAMYQPPPVTFTPPPNFGPSFEMHLDHHTSGGHLLGDSWDGPCFKGASSKIRQFLSPKRGYNVPLQEQYSSSSLEESSESTPPRTILGSPRLHRVLFRQNDDGKQKNVPVSDLGNNLLCSPSTFGSTVASATSSPLPCSDWGTDNTSSVSPKPTMGVAMIGKKPGPTASVVSFNNSLAAMSPPLSPPQTPLSPPPDYPGLEYPPVFEPGIYSLSNSSTFLSQSSSLYSPSSDNSSHQSRW